MYILLLIASSSLSKLKADKLKLRACLESVGSLCCQQALFMLMRRIPKSKIQGVHEQLCFLHHLLHLLLCSVVSKIARGCSGKIVFSNFCHLSLASTGLLFVVPKMPSQ